MKTTVPQLRNTRQRAAIQRVLEDSPRPLSALEVLRLAQKEVPRLGMATVYRNLKSFVRRRWLVPVNLPGGEVLYELMSKGHHHHFRCDKCGRVFDVHNCSPILNRLAESGFEVRRHDLVLYGICRDCRRRR